jgi:FtsZ-interacting cell division protein ZipA
MSSLQIGLAVAGGLVLIGVVVHGAWTSRKNKPRQAEPIAERQYGETDDRAAITPLAASLTHPQESPALDHPPVYPSATPPEVVRQSASTSSKTPAMPATGITTEHAYDRQEPTLDPVSDLARSLMAQATEHAQRVPDETELARLNEARARQPQPTPSPKSAPKSAPTTSHGVKSEAFTEAESIQFLQPEKRPSLDALIDAIVVVEMDTLVSGDFTMAAMPPTRRVGSKFFTIEGLHAETGLWEFPRPGHQYSGFQAGVQLANRSGALNEIEYSEFVLKTQTFADTMGGACEFPDMLEQVARARELDQFASQHDAQLSFNIVATQSAWSPGYVQQNASRLGLVAGAIPGRLVLPGAHSGQPPILVLEFDSQAALAEDPSQTAIRHITLALDVPQVDPSQEPFARMVQVAHELSRVMDGSVTDDNGQPLTEAAIGAIARDLQGLYASLHARDLAAGTPQARRLFS